MPTINFSEYVDGLYSYAVVLSSNRTEAEDMVQETCLRAIRAMQRLHPDSHVKSWLFIILRKRATMFLDVLADALLAPAPRQAEIDRSRHVGNGQQHSNRDRSPYGTLLGLITLVVVACAAPDCIAQGTKNSIDVPPPSRLLLRAVGSGDQVYGCINGSWVLNAPDAKLLNEEGSVIGRHFAGPTWQLNDGSSVRGKTVAKKDAPDATAVPWLLLESVGGNGKLGTVRFIQRTETRGGNAPGGGCSQGATLRVPYTATYSFYEAGQ
jgi:hypothetical protein